MNYLNMIFLISKGYIKFFYTSCWTRITHNPSHYPEIHVSSQEVQARADFRIEVRTARNPLHLSKNFLYTLLRWSIGFLMLLMSSTLTAQSVDNIETPFPTQKQATVFDYLSEGAGASSIFGFFYLDIDTDKDGTPDFFETGTGDDLDGDGITNLLDPDDDNDGILDAADTQPIGVTSMPTTYFRNAAVAAANGNTTGDYWQFVPNNVIVGGPFNGYYEHPGAYLYIDNNTNQIPDILEAATDKMPPYVIDKGVSATHALSGGFQGLLGEWAYSGSPGSNAAERTHDMGETVYYLCDDDGGAAQTNHYTNGSPYGNTYSDIKASTNAQVDYDIYGTTNDSSTLIPQEILGQDVQAEDYFTYRWFDADHINEAREMVFFVATFWSSGGSTVNTYYSKTAFNPDDAPNNPTRNGATTGDDFGGWTGKADWFPLFQHTGDHNQLAAAVFGAGTNWTDIATAPTNGTSPVAVNPADQAWVDKYENWTPDRKIIQYRAVSDWLSTTVVNANSVIQGRYGYDLSMDGQSVIIRAVEGKTPHFMIAVPDGDPDNMIIGMEDLYRGGDRDFEDNVFYLTRIEDVKVTATLSDSYTVNVCSDTIRYTAVIRNSGIVTANNVSFFDVPDVNTRLIVGSVTTSSGSVVIGNNAGHVNVAVTIGNLPTGDSVKIYFEVTVNNGVLPATTTISNQGTVMGSNFSNVLTSDMDTSRYFQPTITDLNQFFGTLTVTCPANQQATVDQNCEFSLADYTGLATSSDFCTSFGVTQSPAIGSTQSAMTTVTLTGIDGLGRNGSCTFDVIPSDQSPPLINCPAHLNLTTTSHTLADYTASVTTSDNCATTIAVSQSPTGGTLLTAESNLVTLTADDGNGNTSDCEFLVNLLLPAKITLSDQVYMGLQNGANLVIDNPNPDAIQANGSTPGHLESEGENNVVKWNIGTGTGDFTVPFSTKWATATYIPLTVSITSAGSSDGAIVFSTYETSTDLNAPFPSGVTNMNFPTQVGPGGLFAVDRFWQIDAGSYSVKPDVILNFTYDDRANEIGGTNAIQEGNLGAHWYDDGANMWQGPLGGVNSTANTVTGVSVSGANFLKTWTLADKGFPFPIVLEAFDAQCEAGGVSLSWMTLSEAESDYYEVARSEDGVLWENVRQFDAEGGTQSPVQYQWTDPAGARYYQLSLISHNGQKAHLATVESYCMDNGQLSLYPNPTQEDATLVLRGFGLESTSFTVVLFDLSGRSLGEKSYSIDNGFKKVELGLRDFPSGIFIVRVAIEGEEVYRQKVVKQ